MLDISRYRNYALIRMPYADEFRFVAQTDGDVAEFESVMDIADKSGFVFAPYEISENCPLMFLKPDVDFFLPVGKSAFQSTHNCDSDNSTRELYDCDFERFIDALKRGTAEKLVLSRSVDVDGDNIKPLELYIRACNNYPRVFIYLCHFESQGTWIGCTPELLLSGDGHECRTVALAGTQHISPDLIHEEKFPLSMWDEKNRCEQRIVEDYIEKSLSSCVSSCIKNGPFTVRAGQLIHLKTEFSFSLNQETSLADVVNLLHPTPAVCGLPKEVAHEFISQNESCNREYFTGFVGMWQMKGNTSLYVNLRCAKIKDNVIRLYAGGGLLSTSRVEQEWNETRDKMRTILDIL